MPKVNDGYEPKWQNARIRAREAEYIRKVAERYDEKFIDALYRIVNVHRDNHLGQTPRTPTQQPIKPITEAALDINNSDIDLELDMFE